MTFDLVSWPVDWRSVPLWSLFRRIKNVGHPDEKMLSVYRDHGVIPKASRSDNFNKTAPNRNIYQLVDEGWLVINRMKAWQGSLGISPERGIVSGHYICFRPEHSEDNRFLDYLLRSDIYTAEFRRMSRGVRPSQIEIDNDELRLLPVRLPSIGEQRAIADFLDTETTRLDALIAKKELLLERLEARFWAAVRALIQEAQAVHVPLRRVLTWITDGPFGSSLKSSHYSDDGARVVRLGNIGRGEFREADRAFIPMAHFANLSRHRVERGDLLIAGLGDATNHVGRACVAPELGPAIVKADCYCARVDQRLASTDFVALYLSSPEAAGAVAALSRGSTRSRIHTGVARDIPVPLPPVELQVRIVDEAATLRTLKNDLAAQLEAQIDLLRERRQALITAAVTGEFEVPGVVV